MGGITLMLVLLCIATSVNGAAVSNIDTILPPSQAQINAIESGIESENTISPIDTIDKLNVCTSEVCAKESTIMRNSMDQTVNPCENFYDFACGNYVRNTVLPEDKAVDLSFFQVQDKVSEQLRLILMEDPQPDELQPFKLAKEFTKICMDEENLNKEGITPMVEILDRYGGWPAVKGESWEAEHWDWVEAKKNILNDGLVDDLILEFAVRTDFRNSSKRILYIDRPDFGLSEKFLLKGMEHPKVKAYYDFMVDTAVIFNANRSNAKLELLDALQFEMDLAKIALSIEERRNMTILTNEYNIFELQTTFPYVNWLEFVDWNLFHNISFNESETVIVPDKNYLQQLGALLQSTPKRTIANYFACRLVIFASELLNDVLHQRSQQFIAATTGMLKSDHRLTECVKRTMEFLPISAGATYIRKLFNGDSKEAAHILVQSIHEEFLKTLERVPWMDEMTRTAALKKANAMNFHIAYSDELIDNAKLEEFYDGLQLQSDSLLQSVLNIRKFNKHFQVNQFREPVNKTDWRDRSTKTTRVDAYYSPPENSILLPAGILQDRFFSANRPAYLNFGAIGWFVGHEITHGFDDNGRQFDLNGNLANWWQKDTEKKFATKAQCFIDQYSKYSHPTLNLTVNGVSSQGENIADNGGIKAAYTAYQRYVEMNKPDPILDGLNYTANQLFWISAGQLWCAVTRPEFDQLQYATNVHTPFNYRIIGAFQNSRDFSNDFNCSSDSPMNPSNKCEIW